jgi:tetratricopeptide (TPR) repeat protein
MVMKYRMLFIMLIAGIFISGLLGFINTKPFTASLPSRNQFVQNPQDIIGCGPNSTPLGPLDNTGRMMVPLPGTGTHTWEVSTLNDSARFYFNQGLNLYYSFHMAESKSSFQEALRHDPGFAMAYWGEALASGPFINVPTFSFNDSAIIASLNKAVSMTNDSMERSLINAQLKRYVTEKDLTHQQLSIAYRDEMKSVYDKYPSNTEIAVLYADAAMIATARNWYTQQSQPKEGTDEIIRLLESIIRKVPNHPAALHYYVHMVEASLTPERATTVADKLLYLLPSVTHMVHMPSHIYIRTGNYKKGILANTLAIEGYDRYKIVIGNGWEGNKGLYLYHNADMQGTNAMMMGNYAETKKYFEQNIDRLSVKDTGLLSRYYPQLVTAQPYLSEVRFGKWNKILKIKQLLSNNTLHKALWQFGQGMASAKTNNIAGARKMLGEMKTTMQDTALSAPMVNISRFIDVLQVPAIILAGTIAQADKNYPEAILLFKKAVEAEDSLRYAEPEAWRLPARHYLGQAYLQIGDYENARQIFQADLVDHPNNFWAVSGLKQTLLKQKKTVALAKLLKKYKPVFLLAGMELNGATF